MELNKVTGTDTATIYTIVLMMIISLKSFDPVIPAQTGTVCGGDVQYRNVEDAIVALSIDILAILEDDVTSVLIPVCWADSHSYNASIADSYAFTTTWGGMPEGVGNND